jgi:hypothetical protein
MVGKKFSQMVKIARNQIETLFGSFVGKQVLILGDVMVDAYLWGKVERISPEAPVPVVSVKKRENLLGGAANVALNIKALGAVPLLCSVVGHDIKGEEFIGLLKQDGISPEGIIQSPAELPPPNSGSSVTKPRYCVSMKRWIPISIRLKKKPYWSA